MKPAPRASGERGPAAAVTVAVRVAMAASAIALPTCWDAVLRAALHSAAPSGDDLRHLQEAYLDAMAHAQLISFPGPRYAWGWRAAASERELVEPLWPLALPFAS